MSTIRKLPDDVSSQIAAGEVVERPASVVKELVENALDAGATRISIAVEAGGKRLIRVEDDGNGMSPDDVRLSIERHATSKIRRAEDLEQVSTLGFRGEALPSIASVSHLRIRTRAQDTESGVELRVNGGVFAAMDQIGAPVGTTVEVSELFYNIPARRKFLKSNGPETTQISRVVGQLALGCHRTGFSLTSGTRSLLKCPPVASLRERLHQLYGDRNELVEVDFVIDTMRVFGFVAALTEHGAQRGPQNIFVNGRSVKDRMIMHAIVDAYGSASIKERRPEVQLFLEVASDAVDVNVHPTKAEVRFREQSRVHQIVRRAVSDALGEGAIPVLSPDQVDASSWSTSKTAEPLPASAAAVFPGRWSVPGLSLDRSAVRRSVAAPFDRDADVTREFSVNELQSNVSFLTSVVPLGQFRNTFIIAVDEQGILLIDQHVAHERVLYERMSERLKCGKLESQRLLQPLLLQVPAENRQTLIAHTEDLNQLGFEVEEFGGDVLRVSAMPAVLGAKRCESALRALGEDLENVDRGSSVTGALNSLAATTACHAAIKANDALTFEKIEYLIAELRQTAYSTICPHGRPVMLRLTRRDIERGFQRI